jgi:serine/threonine-protein kinase
LKQEAMIGVGQTVGNYRITAKLGEGGMGMVFRAEHPVIARRAALKAIHPEFALRPEVISRFVNEAKVISRIGHEHIVEVTDFGRTPEGDFYFIMEHLSGEALSQAIERGGAMPPQRAVAIAAQIADALGASHVHGVVHRDLKPENVFLIDRGGSRDFVKVLDFGLAKLTSGDAATARETRSGMIMGTPYYMAPEQCEGRSEIDGRADVYALGVILFEMLTGSVPFSGESSGEILVKHVTMRPPAARALVPGLPEALDGILDQALAKDPVERFPSMEAFRRALLDVAGAAPEAAPLTPSAGLRSSRLSSTQGLGPGGARPHARTTFREGVGAIASASDLSTLGAELRPARDHGRRWLAAVGAVAALVAWLAGRSAPSPTAAGAMSASLAPAPVPSPGLVRLTFGTDPAGAEVVGPGGRVEGTTPLTIEVPASDAAVRYLLRKHGYLPKATSLIPNVTSPIFLTLEPAPASDPPRPPARARVGGARRPAGSPTLPAPPYEDDVLAPSFR